MQSIFRLPWCSEQIAPKLPDIAPLEKMRPAAVVEIPVWNKLKRKRTNSSDTTSSRMQHKKKERPGDLATIVTPSENVRRKVEDERKWTQESATSHSLSSNNSESRGASTPVTTTLESTNIPAEPNRSRDPVAGAEDVSMLDAQQSTSHGDLTRLQEVIENEFNMQILMKHNELRLIEQELAKCQIALEQLRRVELRPYPGTARPSEDVSNGTGPSIIPPPGYTKPSRPAPYGVTDGPYSRHYNQWLLHDPVFDSNLAQAGYFSESIGHTAGRSTRNSGSVRKSISKPFTFPGRPLETLQSIPNYPAPAAKDKSAALILKRSTDNQFVKLICNNCLRGNFSSIQGFLNHCRIAHKVDYKSHDAAAIDCGRVLDEHEAASLPAEISSTPSHKPSLSRISTATTTPYGNLVHSLNTGVSPSVSRNARHQTKPAPRKPVANVAPAGMLSTESRLTASSSTPRLSAYFAKHQLGGDLAAAVSGAREKVDLDLDEDMSSPDASEQSSPMEPMLHSRTISGTGRASMMTMPGARPTSYKGIRQNARQPRPSPLTSVPSDGVDRRESSEISRSPHYHSLDLSPHTADSNPGLVSDHEDDDHGSASEEEAPQAELSRPFTVGRTCSDNVEVDVAEGDGMDRGGVIIRRNSVYADDEHALRTAGTPTRKLGLSKRGS